MKHGLVALLCLGSLLVTGRSALAACDPGREPDLSDIANARAFIAARCDCGGATRHGVYMKCVVEQGSAVLQNPDCMGAVKRCEARSTCGRPGFVTCCITTLKGTHCAIKRDGPHCRAPRNGTACAGSFTSCCDACTPTGCATTTSTSTSTSTTTTTTLYRIACSGSDGIPPTCDGTCAGDAVCGVDYDMTPTTFNVGCACFPADVTPCGSSDSPQCGGACFGTEVCQAIPLYPPSLGFCTCKEPSTTTDHPCDIVGGTVNAPECGGTCPPPYYCGLSVSHGCTCF